MRRRRFVIGLGSGAAAWPLAGTAQQPAKSLRQIGYLDLPLVQPGPLPPEWLISFFLKGLREGGYIFLTDFLEGGYIEGQNCVIHYRGADWKFERLAGLATELVGLKPDVIFAPTTVAGRAAHQATTTIPIVVASMADPVGDGFVASLARPGGNVTGLTNIPGDLAVKRLSLLKEMVPSATRIAVLWHRGSANDRFAQSVLSAMEAAARSLQVQLRLTELGAPDDLDRAFASIDGQVDACMTALTQALIGDPHKRMIELAAKHRLPMMLPVRYHVEKEGALISYAFDEPELWRRGGIYVARILNGAKPGNLPVEQPIKFELCINLKTAKALGLDVPPSILARADVVIE
jgi:putative ABC transport system substrate-binding protein